MNTAEKIAGAYLRLNGFLLLPHFTAFDGVQHGHVDFIGLRAANSKERIIDPHAERGQIADFVLPIDVNFFEIISEHFNGGSRDLPTVGTIAEVRTNDARVAPTAEHIEYVRKFLGNITLIPVSFADDDNEIAFRSPAVTIGIHYALNWILGRIDLMKRSNMRLTKDGSWTWSEEFLSDILVLHGLGVFR